MASTVTGQRDDDARCWDCGHPWDTDCGCTCCPLDDEDRFALALRAAYDSIARGDDDAV